MASEWLMGRRGYQIPKTFQDALIMFGDFLCIKVLWYLIWLVRHHGDITMWTECGSGRGETLKLMFLTDAAFGSLKHSIPGLCPQLRQKTSLPPTHFPAEKWRCSEPCALGEGLLQLKPRANTGNKKITKRFPCQDPYPATSPDTEKHDHCCSSPPSCTAFSLWWPCGLWAYPVLQKPRPNCTFNGHFLLFSSPFAVELCTRN
ncbi:uncharacterized protein LOC110394773 [Numida meleagris]|uniref:uncharacterized protein LOC110394773 n=1 Tax=Numida meleagris TaxID=8996 RepID=UPI000B3DAE12|nr:uncharacterized protein LOC110394773 [Numida meleagris]